MPFLITISGSLWLSIIIITVIVIINGSCPNPSNPFQDCWNLSTTKHPICLAESEKFSLFSIVSTEVMGRRHTSTFNNYIHWYKRVTCSKTFWNYNLMISILTELEYMLAFSFREGEQVNSKLTVCHTQILWLKQPYYLYMTNNVVLLLCEMSCAACLFIFLFNISCTCVTLDFSARNIGQCWLMSWVRNVKSTISQKEKWKAELVHYQTKDMKKVR